MVRLFPVGWVSPGKLPGGDRTGEREYFTVECFPRCWHCGRALDQEPGDSSLVLVLPANSYRSLFLFEPQLCHVCTERLASVIYLFIYLLFKKKKFFLILSIIERQNMSMGGAERGDTESKAGSRL